MATTAAASPSRVIGTRRTAIYDPGPGTWTAAADKLSNVSEEGWSLLPDGSILAIDATDPPNACSAFAKTM